MRVNVVEHEWPHHCVACVTPLYWSRSVEAGMCCCCRGDHAPDRDVRDELAPSATTWRVAA